MKCKILLLITAICMVGCQSGGLKLKVRFDETDGLKNGDRVYLQNESVGVVNEVIETDQKKYIAALTIQKKIAAQVTRKTRFYIDRDPKENRRSAVVMVLEKSGGTLLKNGDVVDGASRSFAFFHRLRQGAQKGLQDVLSQFDQFSQRLKKIPESNEFHQLESDLKSLADKMAASSKAAKKTIQDELIPELENQLNRLKDRLKALGREKEVEPLEIEMKKIRSIQTKI
jgi:ABC-type transporter Mla subunit MlaD